MDVKAITGKSRKHGRPPKQQRARKKNKENQEKNEEKSIEKTLEQFLLDTGRLSYPTTETEIATEFVTDEISSNLIRDWKHHMELKVTIC